MYKPFFLDTTPLMTPGRTIRVDYHVPRVLSPYFMLSVSVPQNEYATVITLSNNEMLGLLWWFIKATLTKRPDAS